MRVVLGLQSFASLGGTQTYTLTVAEQLERLGHEAWIYTLEAGEMSELARSRGVRILSAARELPRACDAVVSQDAATAHELAARYPGSRRAFVAHSTEFVGQAPPQLAGAPDLVVALNDRIAAHCTALASRPELARLRQPVDLSRFGRLGRRRPRARRALVFGNHQGGAQYATITRCCAELGLEVELLGRHGRATSTPEADLAAGDLVIGLGRCIVEAMAARRAAYVLGVVGGDGWVTPESYRDLEADGFSGRATERVVNSDRLREELAAWSPEMGDHNRDLAYANHDATAHAVRLVAALETGAPRATPAEDAAGELARMARVQSQLESRAIVFAAEARKASRLADEREAELQKAVAQLEAFKATRRYRLAAAMARPLDALRTVSRRLVALRRP